MGVGYTKCGPQFGASFSCIFAGVPWRRAELRGQKIYVLASDDGVPKAARGMVEIRYRPTDGRAYMARVANLKLTDDPVLPDDACATAARVVTKKEDGPRIEARPMAEREFAPGTVIAYVDGACSGNPGPAGLGVVLIDGERRIELSEFLGKSTNNIAELSAIGQALREIPDHRRPMVIHTDSSYSIGVLQKGWKAKANAELIAELRALLSGRPHTRLVYVPGHAGVVLNERADALARAAVKRKGNDRTEIAFKSVAAVEAAALPVDEPDGA